MALASIHTKKLFPVVVNQMQPDEAAMTATLFSQVVTPLPYYNQAAKTKELAKYSPSSLQDWLLEDPDSVLVARTSEIIIGFCFTVFAIASR